MSRYVKHIVIYCDFIVEAINEEEAEKKFQEATLVNVKHIPEHSVVVDDKDYDWVKLED